MPVVKRPLRGEDKLWIDRLFVRTDGSTHRYRRVAKNQNERAARAEEQALTQHWERFGELPSSKTAKQTAPINTGTTSNARWEDAVDHFTTTTLPTKKEMTRRGYQALLEGPHFASWAKTLISAITYRSIQAWDLKLVEAGISPSTRRNHHILLRSIIKSVGPVGDEPGILLTAVPKFPPLPRVGQAEVKATSPEEVDLLLTRVKHQGLRVAIILGAFGGLRAGEIRALTKADIDLKTNKISVSKSRGVEHTSTTKSGHARPIPLNPRAKALLEPILRNLRNEDLVSTTEDGNPWNPDVLSLAYRRWAKRLGLKSTRFHSLRHHFATQCFAKANLPAINVKDLLGHQDLKTTQRYAHASYQISEAGIAKL